MTDQGKLFGKSLEYNIVEHCNLRCAHCDHASPLLRPTFIDPDAYRRDLQAVAEVLRVDELKIIGGEPLLHPRVQDFIDVGRQLGLARRITVATNGLLLHKMDEAFWRSIDRLWLSVYPGIKPKIGVDDARALADRNDVVLDVHRMDAFRKTMLNRPHKNEDLVRRLAARCHLPKVNWCHTVRQGIYYRCSPAPFARDRLKLSGIVHDPDGDNGIALHGNANLRSELKRYINSDEPLPACYFCLGHLGPCFDHRQLGKEELAATLSEPDSIEELEAFLEQALG